MAQASKKNIRPWVVQVMERDEKASSNKLVNYPVNLDQEKLKQHQASVREAFQQFAYADDDGIIVRSPDCLLTVANSMTSIHHDILPSVSTVRTFGDSSDFLKIWFFWPKSQTSKVAYNGEYGNTRPVMKQLQHGRFAGQRAGESIYVPKDWLHLVISSKPCVLYGSNIEIPHARDLPYLQPEIFSGYDARDLSQNYISSLRDALLDGDSF